MQEGLHLVERPGDPFKEDSRRFLEGPGGSEGGLEGVRGRLGAGAGEDEGVLLSRGVQARSGGGPGAREGKEAGAAEGGAGSAEVNI